MMTKRRVWVSMNVFEGSAETWAKLKVGDVLRVEAEEDKYTNEFRNDGVTLKATEAILVSRTHGHEFNRIGKTDVREALRMRKEFEVRQCVCVRACIYRESVLFIGTQFSILYTSMCFTMK
jgi:hypothetical protein